jgi:hypothetical protein
VGGAAERPLDVSAFLEDVHALSDRLWQLDGDAGQAAAQIDPVLATIRGVFSSAEALDSR